MHLGEIHSVCGGGSVVKNPPANAGDTGSIPGSGRSPEKELATHSNILAWEIPWTEGIYIYNIYCIYHEY